MDTGWRLKDLAMGELLLLLRLCWYYVGYVGISLVVIPSLK